MAAPAPVTIYKLGGSLLSLSDLRARILRLFENREESRGLLIVGGGAAAELVRRWNREHALTADAAHDLALRAMMLNERLVQHLLSDSLIVSTREEAEWCWDKGIQPILSAEPFLQGEEPAGDLPLPHTWDVTSDSIAAWVAIRWPAARLVLLKSTSTAHRKDIVDAHFKYLLPKLSDVSLVNLRADDSTAQRLADCV